MAFRVFIDHVVRSAGCELGGAHAPYQVLGGFEVVRRKVEVDLLWALRIGPGRFVPVRALECEPGQLTVRPSDQDPAIGIHRTIGHVEQRCVERCKCAGISETVEDDIADPARLGLPVGYVGIGAQAERVAGRVRKDRAISTHGGSRFPPSRNTTSDVGSASCTGMSRCNC